MEQPWDNRARRFLDCQGALALALQHGPQGGRGRELPSLRVLGLTRLQSQPAALGDVGDGERRLEVVGQTRQHGTERVALEESRPGIVLLILAYVRHREQQHAANATINRELAALKRMFRLGERAGKIVRRPFMCFWDVNRDLWSSDPQVECLAFDLRALPGDDRGEK